MKMKLLDYTLIGILASGMATQAIAQDQALAPIGLEPATVSAPSFAVTANGKVQMLGGRAYNLYYI